MITIQVDTKEATRWLNDVQRKQVQHMTSRMESLARTVQWTTFSSEKRRA